MKRLNIILIFYFSSVNALDEFSPRSDFNLTATLDVPDNTIIYQVEVPQGYWFGLGFGTSMTNASILVVNANEEFNPPLLNDTFAKGHGFPRLQDVNIYKLLSSELTEEGIWILEISRPIVYQEGDRNDTLRFDSRIDMIYAYGESSFARHSRTNRGFFSMRLNSQSRLITFKQFADAGDVYYKIHGIIMYITWSILTFLAILSGRYMKHLYNFRMIIHASVGTLIMSNTVILVVLALGTYPAKGTPKVAHKPIGIIVMVISVLQFMGGMTVKQTNSNLEWKSKWASFSKLGHQCFGLFLILFSNFQVATGLVNYESPVKNLIYVHFAVYLVILAIIEILYRWRYKYTDKGVVKKENVPIITQLQLNTMVRNGRKLVLFNNFILDVESFMDEHPGTRFVIAENIGSDIGKYFYGAYSVEADVAPHTHSSYASTLITKLTIGKLKQAKSKVESRASIKSEGDQDVLVSKFVSIGIFK